MKIILGSRLFERRPFENEDELETVVRTRPEVILGFMQENAGERHINEARREKRGSCS